MNRESKISTLTPNENIKAKALNALSIIDVAIKAHNLDAVFALVSGGNDSMAMLLLTSLHEKFAGVIHIDTMTGITDSESWKTGQPESIATRHVIQTASDMGFDLIVKTPFTRYEMLIVKIGFPSAPMHLSMYQFLKERPLMQAKKDAKKIGGKRIGFVTGVRVGESDRRKVNVQTIHEWKNAVAWINPLWNWSNYEQRQFTEYAVKDKNPVTITMGMSGECGCGAYASPEEFRVIEHHYPEQAKRIRQWENIVDSSRQLMGIASQYCQWGNGNGKRIPDNQMELPGMELCASCIGSQVNRNLNMHKQAKKLNQANEETI